MTHPVCLRWQLQWPLCSISSIIQLNCAKGAKSYRKPNDQRIPSGLCERGEHTSQWSTPRPWGSDIGSCGAGCQSGTGAWAAGAPGWEICL